MPHLQNHQNKATSIRHTPNMCVNNGVMIKFTYQIYFSSCVIITSNVQLLSVYRITLLRQVLVIFDHKNIGFTQCKELNFLLLAVAGITIISAANNIYFRY